MTEQPNTVPARDLRPGQFIDIVDIVEFVDSEYREVLLVDPTDDGRYVLIALRGGIAERVPVDRPIRPIPDTELEAARDRERERQRRAKVAAALRRLLDLIEGGMPLPIGSLSINGALGSFEDLERVAEMLGEQIRHVVHDDGRAAPDIHHYFGDDQYQSGIQLFVWHLGERPEQPERGDPS